jgi:hypothetical protein
MQYPEDMTKEEIAEFEREYEQWLAEERAYHDAMERDHDEEYIPDPDSEYENQYELDTDYL